MNVLDLFSGIGGFSLGLERAGMKTVAFCEIEPFPRAVLAKHWPEVPCYDDIRTLTGERLAADGISVDVICGGFPCQDISFAGKGAGLAGERSGLWREYARLIGDIRPRFVIVENVAALLSQGLGDVLGDLAALGYDAEWHCIPASVVGAPHRRDRVWIVAHPHNARHGVAGEVQPGRGEPCGGERMGSAPGGGRYDVADPKGERPGETRGFRRDEPAQRAPGCSETVADASSAGLPGAERPGRGVPIVTPADLWRATAKCSWRRAEPGMGGTDDGVPGRAYGSRGVEAWEGDTPRTVGKGFPNRRPRLMALGNAVVPQIPELIGRAIMEANP